jgi:hypothetical protein
MSTRVLSCLPSYPVAFEAFAPLNRITKAKMGLSVLKTATGESPFLEIAPETLLWFTIFAMCVTAQKRAEET